MANDRKRENNTDERLGNKARRISKNWRRQNILIFAVVNLNYNSKIQLTAEISKNVDICARGTHKM